MSRIRKGRVPPKILNQLDNSLNGRTDCVTTIPHTPSIGKMIDGGFEE